MIKSTKLKPTIKTIPKNKAKTKLIHSFYHKIPHPLQTVFLIYCIHKIKGNNKASSVKPYGCFKSRSYKNPKEF